METQHWIETALEREYIDQTTSTQLIGKCLEIGRMLNGMMDKAEMFCGEPPRTLREELSQSTSQNLTTKTLITDHCLLINWRLLWQQKYLFQD